VKESLIVRQILDYCAAKHVFAFQLGTGKFFFEGRAFKSHSLGPGAADILVPREGSVWIECKNETGRQSAVQKMFAEECRERGDRYIVARSVDDVKGWV
jgi:hypothetical protein